MLFLRFHLSADKYDSVIYFAPTDATMFQNIHQFQGDRISGVASPTVLSRYANFKLLSLFIALEIDSFHSQWTVNICIAGLNRRAGYATGSNTISFGSELHYLKQKTV